MRVALVVEKFAAGGGGVEDVAWQAAHGLAAAGEDVHVFCRQATPGASVTVRELRVPRAWQPLRVVAFDRAAAAATRQSEFDVVHSLTRTSRQDVFFAGGGSHRDYMQSQYSRTGAALRRVSPRHVPLLAIERRVFADARQIVHCNSEMVARQIAARFGVPAPRIEVIANGVDLERYHPARRGDAGGSLRDELGADAETVWVFAGSGWRRKGLEVALQALRQSGTGAMLWVVGRDPTSPWEARARALGVAARVRFLGFRSDLENVYAAADGLLLPTRYDSFSTVCLEAAAAGLPVVTSGTNGAGEFVAKSGAGVCVADPGDVAGFAAALSHFDDAGLRGEAGALARRQAEGYAWDVHVAKLRALYARVARSRRGGGS